MRLSAPILFLACALAASSPSSLLAAWAINQPTAGEDVPKSDNIDAVGTAPEGHDEVRLELKKKNAMGVYIQVDSTTVLTEEIGEDGGPVRWENSFDPQDLGDYRLELQDSTGIMKTSVDFEVVPDP